MELLAAMEASALETGSGIFHGNLRAIFVNAAGSNLTRFAETCWLSRKSARCLMRGDQRPSLATVLTIAARTNLSVVKLVSRSVSADEWPTGVAFSTGTRHRLCKRYDLLAIKASLDSHCKNRESPPTSLHQICRRNNWDPGHLRHLFPDETRCLIEQYREFILKRKEKRQSDELEDIKRAFVLAQSSQEFPSERRLKRYLRCRGLMRNPGIRQERRRMLAAAFLCKRESRGS
jgi:hypothetical protein